MARRRRRGSERYKDVKINDSKSKPKVTQNGYLAPLSLQPQSVNLFSFGACAAPLRAWRRNTKEAGCCISLSLELFKEHAAPRLHANAIVILLFLFAAAAALTFCAFRESFFSGERKLSAERRGGVPVTLSSLRSSPFLGWGLNGRSINAPYSHLRAVCDFGGVFLETQSFGLAPPSCFLLLKTDLEKVSSSRWSQRSCRVDVWLCGNITDLQRGNPKKNKNPDVCVRGCRIFTRQRRDCPNAAGGVNADRHTPSPGIIIQGRRK